MKAVISNIRNQNSTRPYAPKTRVYVSNIPTEYEQANRSNLNLIRTTILPVLQQQFPGDQFKLNFSSTAGCSCGCSPGFIVNSQQTNSISHGKNIWVNIRN